MSATDFRQNYFEFAGLDSRDYKIVLSNDNGFDSPERDVEEVVIPGRNGTLILDNGRWKNQTITYNNCFIESSFETYFETLRADICTKFGYQRLEDSFHPNHYRMAMLEGTIEPKLGTNYAAGYFDVKFNVKPQKFLKSGETAVSVSSGGAITNPTLFDSHPMLEATGYGNISIAGQEIKIENTTIGPITVAARQTIQKAIACTVDFGAQYANIGDRISIESISVRDWSWNVDSGTITSVTASGSNGPAYVPVQMLSCFEPGLFLNNVEFDYGTAGTVTNVGTFVADTSDFGTATGTLTLSAAYDGAHTIAVTTVPLFPAHFNRQAAVNPGMINCGSTILDSTQFATGNPMYLDLDIGEAYKIEGGVPVSVNNSVQLPAELPVLKPGSNVITFDNTILQLKIAPRWYTI